ncbi:hypothetical protein PAMP_003651 [Pampus punctatissimus]
MCPFTSNQDAVSYSEISLREKHKEQDSEDYLLLIWYVSGSYMAFGHRSSEMTETFYLSSVTGAEESNAAVRGKEREKRSLPYWGLWSSDFYRWLEELQAQAAYDGMRDLAHTFWAHFPISSELGYDSPESDSQPEE